MAIEVDYKGEKLNYISDFHGHKVLWITDPLQKDMEHMTFVGGYPNEYCIYLKDLLPEERNNIYKQVFENYVGKDNVADKYIPAPNKQGFFEYNGNWYIFSTDEKAYPDITGPFNDEDMIYALALLLHLGEKSEFKSRRFSDEAMEIYIHNHFRSIEEIDERLSAHTIPSTFDEKVLSYEMGAKDAILAKIAQLIVGAYNGEQKPHRIPKEREVAPPYYRWKHSPEGYSLLTSETEDFSSPTVLLTDAHINDFVEHVFLVLAGDTTVKWNEVYTSKAVLLALEKYFGMKVDLSNIGPEHETEGIFGTPKLPIRPTIWVDHNIQVDDYKRDILLREGFKCYKHDKETWGLEL